MSFQRPTLEQLTTWVEADFVSRLELTGALLRRSMVGVLSRVVAGVAHLLHGRLEYLAAQLFPDTSDDAYLVRQAALFGVFKRDASFARGTVAATGVNGSIVPAGARVARADGVEYAVDADVTVASGTASLAVTAVTAGASPTLASGVALTFVSPLPGVSAQASAVASTLDGADQESTESLRARLLERMATDANGGTETDYETWALEVPGVTRAWAYPLGLGPGTVVVRFVRDNDSGGLIPSSGEVSAVQAYVDERKPAHATVTVVAPVAAPVNVTLSITPNTLALRTEVSAALASVFLGVGPGETVKRSALQVAVGGVEGVTDFSVTTPGSNVTHTANQVPVLGTVTFT